jgi:hypothetical protein
VTAPALLRVQGGAPVDVAAAAALLTVAAQFLSMQTFWRELSMLTRW